MATTFQSSKQGNSKRRTAGQHHLLYKNNSKLFCAFPFTFASPVAVLRLKDGRLVAEGDLIPLVVLCPELAALLAPTLPGGAAVGRAGRPGAPRVVFVVVKVS